MAGITFRTSTVEAVPVLRKYNQHRFFDHEPKVCTRAHFVESLDVYKTQGCVEVLQGTPLSQDFCGQSNGFVMAVTHAYNRHHNLIIRPDDVWLAVIAQFGFFVNANAESMRHLFVSHQDGQKQLVVSQAATLSTANYAALAQAMTGQLRKNVKESSFCDWVLPDFSTTTSNNVVVGSVLLMGTLKQYFKYKFRLCCGIPAVTLLGTTEDWQKVHERVGELAKYGEVCARWCAMLRKVTVQLMESSKGNVDGGFWSRVCHYSGGGSGPSYLSGWVTAFCVFGENGEWQGGAGGADFPKLDTSHIPPGYLAVDVVVDDNGCSYDTLMFAGHLGYDVVGEDKMGISPKVAWAIALRDKSKAQEQPVNKRHKHGVSQQLVS